MIEGMERVYSSPRTGEIRAYGLECQLANGLGCCTLTLQALIALCVSHFLLCLSTCLTLNWLTP
jgi:hypothetical protein